MWRQFLESTQHDNNCFVTLTYDDRSIPGNWALSPRDLQLFIKRLRAALHPMPIRYFAVGEYGDTSRRPHYHLSVFGVSGYMLVNDKPLVIEAYPRGIKRVVGGIIHECWGNGLVDVQEFNHVTAAYVAGYTTKKVNDYVNKRVWNYPEFMRSSNRPGLGVVAMEHIARILLNTYTNWETGDVPTILSIGEKRIPLGRYLLKVLRQKVGFSDGLSTEVDEKGKPYWKYRETEDYIRLAKQRLTDQRVVEMQALFTLDGGNSFKGAYLKDIKGQMQRVEARAKRQRILKLQRAGIL